jgi:hypothetical protein
MEAHNLPAAMNVRGAGLLYPNGMPDIGTVYWAIRLFRICPQMVPAESQGCPTNPGSMDYLHDIPKELS